MPEQNLFLKAGEIVVFSSGEYSDFGYRGSFVVLQDVPESELIAVFEAIKARETAANEAGNWMIDSHSEFESALIRHGWLAQINHREIHIGSYGSLEL